MNAAIPTRHEKQRIARTLGLKGESLVYRWCEDPDGSGKASPLDRLEVIVDHALVHHADAACAIVQRLERKCLLSAAVRAEALPLADLLVLLQPTSEREAMEAVGAFSTALRQIVLGGDYDSRTLLREVEEAERALKSAGVMLRAAIDAEAVR